MLSNTCRVREYDEIRSVKSIALAQAGIETSQGSIDGHESLVDLQGIGSIAVVGRDDGNTGRIPFARTPSAASAVSAGE
jgi:hypothetical protein